MFPREEEWGFQTLAPNPDSTPRFAPVDRDVFTNVFRDEVSRTVIAFIRERVQIGIPYTREQHLSLIPQVAMIMRDVWNEVVIQTRNPRLVAQVFDAQADLVLVEAMAAANSTSPVLVSGSVIRSDGLVQTASSVYGSEGHVRQRIQQRNFQGPYQRPKCPKCNKKHGGVCLAGKCFNCGVKGHFSKSCPKPQRNSNLPNLLSQNML